MGVRKKRSKQGKRVRVVEWVVDEKGQKVESTRTRKGECYKCGWPAYRVVLAMVEGKRARVPVCTRENRRVTLHGSLENTKRRLRDKDLELARIMIAREPGCTCADVARAVNAQREREGLEPVDYRRVLRNACSHSKGYVGYLQQE